MILGDGHQSIHGDLHTHVWIPIMGRMTITHLQSFDHDS